MRNFVGRVEELAVLESAYEKAESAMIPIYGRRRIGKTELILEFIRSKRAVYYLGQQATAASQLASFLECLGECLACPSLGQTQVNNWQQAFDLTLEMWPENEPIVIVLDEFQWVVGASPELPSLLQNLWDMQWKRRGDVMLILCGSYLGFMEKEVLGRKSPLFGRRTAQIKLEPFTYREAAEFHPSWSYEEKAMAWFLCGGIPYYLECFDEGGSVPQNIRNAFLKPYSPLNKESEYLLREELRELENYHAILLELSKANQTTKQLANKTGISERSIQYFLTQLEELHYIAKKFPLVPGKKPRRVLYSLSDPLLRFWFRFVQSRQGLLNHLGPRAFYDKKIAPEISAYFGFCFEKLCREYLPRWYIQSEIFEGFEIGEYWDKSMQLDVVSVREDKVIDLGECKWGDDVSTSSVFSSLQKKSDLYPNEENWRFNLHLFTRTPVSHNNLVCHTLEQMYEV